MARAVQPHRGKNGKRRPAAALAEALESRTLLSGIILPAGPDFVVNGSAAGQGGVSVAGSETGDYLAAWTGGSSLFTAGAHFQRLAATSTAKGDPVRVSATAVPALAAMDESGGYAVAFTYLNGSLHLRRHRADGGILLSSLQLNASTSGEFHSPAVVLHPAGGLTAAWVASVGDGSGTGIIARRFSATYQATDEILVNTTTAGNQLSPTIAMDAAGNTLILWSGPGEAGDAGDIFGRWFDASFAPVGEEFHINSTMAGVQSHPKIAVDAAGQFMVVWQSAGTDGRVDVVGRLISATGEHGPEIIVTASPAAAQARPVVTALPGAFFFAWTAPDAQASTDIVGRLYTAEGIALGEAFTLNSGVAGAQSAPVLAAGAPGHVLAAWVDGAATLPVIRARRFVWLDGTGIEGQVWLDANANGLRDAGEAGIDGATVQLLDAAGKVLQSVQTAGGGRYGFPHLAAGQAVSLRFISPAGLAPTIGGGDSYAGPITGFGPVFLIPEAQPAIVNAGFTAEAVISGLVFVDLNEDGVRQAAEEAPRTSMTIFIDQNGNGQHDPEEPGVPVGANGAWSLGSISLGEHRLGIASAYHPWALTVPQQAVFTAQPGAVLNRNIGVRPLAALPVVPPTGGRTIAQNADSQGEHAVAIDAAGNAVVAWVAKATDGSTRVYAQRLDTANEPRGEVFLVNPVNAGGNKWLEVASNDEGRFVIVWEGSSEVYARVYDSDGNPVTDELRVRQATGAGMTCGRVSMDAKGNFTVTWQRNSPTTIAARRYSSDGTPLGPDGVISTHASGGRNPMPATNSDGVTVVVWRTVGTGLDQIRGRLFGADGTPFGSDFGISDDIAVLKQDPVVGIADDGGFVVMWPQGSDLLARIFLPGGTPAGPAFVVGAFDAQGWGWRIAVDRDGYFVTRFGTQLRLYAPTGSLISQNTIVSGRDLAFRAGRGIQAGMGAAVRVDRFHISPAPAALSGRVWTDLDGDGMRGEAEPGVANVQVSIFNSTGRLLGQGLTRSDGTWRIGAIAPGEGIYAQFLLPSGVAFTRHFAGSNNAADPTTGRTAAFTLAAGQQRQGIDAGLVQIARWTASAGGEYRLVREADLLQLQDAAGAALASFAPSAALHLTFAGERNVLMLDFAGGQVIPLAGLRIEGGGEDGLLIAGASHLALDGAGAIIDGRAITLAGVAQVQLDPAAGAMESLSLSGPARIVLPAGRGPLLVHELSIADDGLLDLADNDLILRAALPADALAALRHLLYRGAIASAPSAHLGLTLRANDDGDGQPLLSALGGHSLLAGDLLVRCGVRGDMNLDGLLDGDDYFELDRAFLMEAGLTPHHPADLNFDGKVDDADYFILDHTFLAFNAAPPPAPGYGSAQAASPPVGEEDEERLWD